MQQQQAQVHFFLTTPPKKKKVRQRIIFSRFGMAPFKKNPENHLCLLSSVHFFQLLLQTICTVG